MELIEVKEVPDGKMRRRPAQNGRRRGIEITVDVDKQPIVRREVKRRQRVAEPALDKLNSLVIYQRRRTPSREMTSPRGSGPVVGQALKAVKAKEPGLGIVQVLRPVSGGFSLVDAELEVYGTSLHVSHGHIEQAKSRRHPGRNRQATLAQLSSGINEVRSPIEKTCRIAGTVSPKHRQAILDPFTDHAGNIAGLAP